MEDDSNQDDFFARRRSTLVPFCVNDPVEITAGQHAGKGGSVVARIAAGHTYLVEFEDGSEAVVPLANLRRAPSAISLEALLDLVDRQLADCSSEFKAEFARHRIPPAKWALSPWGDDSGGFWVLAVCADKVFWYNDIEDGFNVSRFDASGVIPSDEYWCNQDPICRAVESLLTEGAR